MRKGLWSPEEDEKLKCCIAKYMNGSWSDIARKAGLQRCGKSCRRRWMNHLRPDLKRGKFTQAEIRLVIELQKAMGNRWSEIAAHLVGRTDNDVKNLWNTQIKKKLRCERSSNEVGASSSQKSTSEYDKARDSSRSDISSFSNGVFPFAEVDAPLIGGKNRSLLSDGAPNFPFCIDNVVESLPQRWRAIKLDGSENQIVYSPCESRAYHSNYGTDSGGLISAGCSVTDEWPCSRSASCPDIGALAGGDQPKLAESVIQTPKPISDTGFEAIPPPAARISCTISDPASQLGIDACNIPWNEPQQQQQRPAASEEICLQQSDVENDMAIVANKILMEVSAAKSATENASCGGWLYRAATSVGSSSTIRQEEQILPGNYSDKECSSNNSKASDCTSPAPNCMDSEAMQLEWVSYGSLETLHEIEIDTTPALLCDSWPFDSFAASNSFWQVCGDHNSIAL